MASPRPSTPEDCRGERLQSLELWVQSAKTPASSVNGIWGLNRIGGQINSVFITPTARWPWASALGPPNLVARSFNSSSKTPLMEDISREPCWSAWTDRLSWSENDWRKYINRDALKTFVSKLDGVEVGYFELEVQASRSVEIAYFGFLPNYIGKGLCGSFFLQE